MSGLFRCAEYICEEFFGLEPDVAIPSNVRSVPIENRLQNTSLRVLMSQSLRMSGLFRYEHPENIIDLVREGVAIPSNVRSVPIKVIGKVEFEGVTGRNPFECQVCSDIHE